MKSIVSHREVGKQTQTFASALKAALREDPDVILVGEMRDLETVSLALTAAETGHLVFELYTLVVHQILLTGSLTCFHLNNKHKSEHKFLHH